MSIWGKHLFTNQPGQFSLMSTNKMCLQGKYALFISTWHQAQISGVRSRSCLRKKSSGHPSLHPSCTYILLCTLAVPIWPTPPPGGSALSSAKQDQVCSVPQPPGWNWQAFLLLPPGSSYHHPSPTSTIIIILYQRFSVVPITVLHVLLKHVLHVLLTTTLLYHYCSHFIHMTLRH